MNRRELLINAALNTRPAVPSGYTELEYLNKTNRSSRVDTPIPVKTTYKVSGKLTWHTYGWMMFLGITSQYDGEMDYIILMGERIQVAVYSPAMRLQAKLVHENVPFEFISDLRAGHCTFTVDGLTNPGRCPYVNRTMKAGNNPLKFMIGASNWRGSQSTSYSATGRIYYLKFEDEDGTILAWYVPVKRNSDNKYGFYDVQNKTFLLPNTQSGWVAP